MAEPILAIEHLSKTFPGLQALRDVSLAVARGEILGLVGQNGSGKSTLIKILAGFHEPDPGSRISIRGQETFRSAERAAYEGLHFIHQDLALIPMLSTIENLTLGRRLGRRALLPSSRRREEQKAKALLDQFGVAFDVLCPVGTLTPAEQTIVAIIRALEGWAHGDNLLVLDEPTATLHGVEVAKLFTAVHRVAELGSGVIFVSHRLSEVEDLADRVAVLRDGRLVADVRRGEYSQHDLVRLMAGAEIEEPLAAPEVQVGRSVLELRGVGGPALGNLDVTVREGEIVGVCGLLGSGVDQLGSILFGAVEWRTGEVILDGKRLPVGRPDRAVAEGMAYLPADRHRRGSVMSMTARENLTMPLLSPLRRRFGFLSGRAEKIETRRWISKVDVRPREPDRPLWEFSGGNQQKLLFAKWLRTRPKVLVLEEPTHGVDVAAKAAIHELIRRSAAEGTSVVIASTDADELIALCDRVLVLRDGRLGVELSRHQLSEQVLVREALGLAAGSPLAHALTGDGDDD